MHILVDVSSLFNTFRIKYMYQTSVHPITQFQYRLGLMTSMAVYGKENSAETNDNICELKD